MLETILNKYRNFEGCKLLVDEIDFYLKSDNFHLSAIVNLTCDFYKITTIDLFGKDSHEEPVKRRKFFFYFCDRLGYSVLHLCTESSFDRNSIYPAIKQMTYLSKKKNDIALLSEYCGYEKFMLSNLRDKYDKIIDYDSFDN